MVYLQLVVVLGLIFLGVRMGGIGWASPAAPACSS
ncbi:Uncharacterised protein [Chromobacterium violaceum]|uniref:Uncharacterized protein n=1 Tax=Chromobacterium violaceum TaxID=536 RepID=A0A447TIS3_CHRVL|nr:Uncharacterised protein [Chromobacterium violaceum]